MLTFSVSLCCVKNLWRWGDDGGGGDGGDGGDGGGGGDGGDGHFLICPALDTFPIPLFPHPRETRLKIHILAHKNPNGPINTGVILCPAAFHKYWSLVLHGSYAYALAYIITRHPVLRTTQSSLRFPHSQTRSTEHDVYFSRHQGSPRRRLLVQLCSLKSTTKYSTMST